MNRTLFAAVLLSAVSLSAYAGGGNVEAGKAKAAPCFACHGEGGVKPVLPDAPVLAGQHADYLMAAMNQYKAGKRKNPIMGAQASQLKAEDIRDLAAYFSSQSSDLKMKY